MLFGRPTRHRKLVSRTLLYCRTEVSLSGLEVAEQVLSLCSLAVSQSFSLFSPLPLSSPIYFFQCTRCVCLLKYLHDCATLVSDITGLMARGMSVRRHKCCSRCAPASDTGSNSSFPIVWVSKSSCIDGRIQTICFKDLSNIFWMWCERREAQSRHGNGLPCHATDPILREVTVVEILKVHRFIINR